MTVITIGLGVTTARNHGIGAVSGTIHNVLVKLETSDGLAGWGEASPWAAFTATAEAAAGVLGAHLRPARSTNGTRASSNSPGVRRTGT